MIKDLQDEVTIITGGNAGIGKAIAKKFAELGARLILVGTNQNTGIAAVEELKQITSSSIQFEAVDVSQTKLVEDFIKKIIQDYGRIDILVNNAGITADQLLMKMSEEDWDRVLTINLKSCFNTCRSVIRPMMKAKKGKIINISSVVGLTGNSGQANYAASKAGMIGLSKALAKEVASRQICVNCIAPGFIQTAMTDKLSEQQKSAILQQIPLGRMGDVTDIAEGAAFLASSRSNYMTGQVLTIDGGMVMS